MTTTTATVISLWSVDHWEWAWWLRRQHTFARAPGCMLFCKFFLSSLLKWKSLSCVQLFATLWTAHQASLSMKFSRQQHWSGLPFSSPLLYLGQFSSVVQPCLNLCNPIECSTSGLPVHHQLLGFTQTHVHWNGDAIQLSHPLSSPSPPAFNLSQHQSLFKWVSSLHQVAKGLEFQLQHQFFQWIFRTDFL